MAEPTGPNPNAPPFIPGVAVLDMDPIETPKVESGTVAF